MSFYIYFIICNVETIHPALSLLWLLPVHLGGDAVQVPTALLGQTPPSVAGPFYQSGVLQGLQRLACHTASTTTEVRRAHAVPLATCDRTEPLSNRSSPNPFTPVTNWQHYTNSFEPSTRPRFRYSDVDGHRLPAYPTGRLKFFSSRREEKNFSIPVVYLFQIGDNLPPELYS